MRNQVKCPVCNSANVCFKYHTNPFSLSIYECKACHSQFQYPTPRNADQFYTQGYYEGSKTFSYQDERRDEHFQNFVHRARLKTIRRYVADGKFLDVGCAFGAFSRAAAQNFEAYGLDVSRYAVSEGNTICKQFKSGVRLFQGDLCHLPQKNPAKQIFRKGSFAVIALIEVAEHLKNPRDDFKSAYELLKANGLLIIQTANFEGLQAIKAGRHYHYYLPGHLVYFTATGLKNLLKEIGFTRFIEHTPTDFSLTAKWRKARAQYHYFWNIRRFIKMSWYHCISKFKWKGRPLTSSYVLYAFK